MNPRRSSATSRSRLVLFASILTVLATCSGGFADDGAIETVGAGSYATHPPPGGKSPPDTIYRTDSARGPMPTNDWWSSVAWVKYSEPQYPHPLAVRAQAEGLRIYYPGRNIGTSKDAIFGAMPAGGEDLVLGNATADGFDDARVDGWSDWFVRVRLGGKGKTGGMVVTYGHGSPFVFATYDDGGAARVTFAAEPKVWSGDARGAVLGVTMNGAHYGLFGPTGSTWEGIGAKVLTNRAAGEKRYFSLAVLPEAGEKALGLFRRYAYAHVTDTKVSWSYEPKTAAVTTRLDFTTHSYEPADAKAPGTLFALYPHQWRHTSTPLLGPTYASVRGTMKLAAGTSFTTEVPFPGVLPALPRTQGCDPKRMAEYVRQEVARDDPAARDTYGEGKWLGREACVIPIAEQHGLADEAAKLTDRVRARLEDWLTAGAADGKPKSRRVFAYNDRWGTLIGYPAGFGSDTELNDHHFHYGYFLRAAAEVARRDPAWAADGRFGGMVKLLARDIASADRADPMFPFLRNFDPYAGHSWASGHAKFGDGNNQESSSEAMNAWYGLILWGEATGNVQLRDLGVWLYTTEMNAIEEYWFDVHGDNFPRAYTPSVVTMVWGGKGANGTWFSNQPEAVHAINFLPITGGSLYLGQYPDYAKKNYEAMLAERGGKPNWRQWSDILWMYRALSDPGDASRQFEAGAGRVRHEEGNALANTYQWIGAMKTFGPVDRTVTADHVLAAVFRKGDERTYVAYVDGPEVVKFSDGYELRAKGKGWATAKRDVPKR
jgi:endoglucanase Acf2